MRQLHQETHRRILEHEMDITEFCKTENLNHSLEEYMESFEKAEAKGKRASRRAVYELWKKHEKEFDFRQGDRLSFYNTGSRASHSDIEHSKLAMHYDPKNPDENTARLLKRLKEFTKRFKPAFNDEDFEKIFAREDISEGEIAAIRAVARRLEPAAGKEGKDA